MTMESQTSEMSETLKEAVKKVGDYLKREKPYLFEIDKHIQTRMQNGVIQISVRVYNGKVTDVLLVDTRRISFQDKKGR